MEPLQSKLSEIFNRYADKIVDGREFERLFERAVNTSFNDEDLHTFYRLGAPKGDLDMSEGIYASDNDIYYSGAFLRNNTVEEHIPASIRDKVADAFAEALQKAKDHSEAVKNGSLKSYNPTPRKGGWL